MKIYIIILISLVSCWSCDIKQGISRSNLNTVQTVKNKPLPDSETVLPTPKPSENACSSRKNFRIDTIIDSKLENSSYYRDGLLTKLKFFNLETKEIMTEIDYFYKKDRSFDYQKVIKGKYVDDSEEMALENEQSQKDFKFQCSLLKSKGIEFPFAEIVIDNIGSLSNIFSIADNYDDFKKIIKTDGNKKIFRFTDFNKKIRFDPNEMTMIVGKNNILIKNYELILEEGYPSKELYKTANGKLIIEYFYKDGRLTSFIYKFTNLKNKTISLKKQFEYYM